MTELEADSTLDLTATVYPTNADTQTVTWSSSDTSVATVDSNGTVTDLTSGTFTITVTTDDGSFIDTTSTITVPTVYVTSVSITDPGVTELEADSTLDLTANVYPTNADTQTVTWSSSDSSVATVDSNGTITAISPGTFTITVTTDDGSFTNTTATMTVPDVLVNSISSDTTTLELDVNQTSQIQLTILPVDVTDSSVTWVSSDSTIATVDSEGWVTGITDGSVTITATAVDASGEYISIPVTVTTPSTGIIIEIE